jgi:hypothetical protein
MSMNGAYFNGMDQKNGKNGLQTALDNIKGSVTTDYILMSLNVKGRPPGDPKGNDPKYADINYGWNFGQILASGGKIAGGTRDLLLPVVKAGVANGKLKRVLLGIGGAVWEDPPPDHPEYRQWTETFTNMKKIFDSGGLLESTLLDNFAAIVAAIKELTGHDNVGFDMDYEEDGDKLAAAVAKATIKLRFRIKEKLKFDCPITFCPSFDDVQDKWIDALEEVNKWFSPQPVVGYNLQCYSGGGNNNPADWTATIKDAIKNGKKLGIPDPDNFVWPILSCSPDDNSFPVTLPDKVAGQLKDWVYQGKKTGFHSRGGALWCTSALKPQNDYTLTEYSKAIAQGIV